MKQKLLKTWLMLVCLIVGVGTTWAEEVNFTMGSDKDVTSNSGATKSGITITATDGTSATNNWGGTTYVRLQAGGTLVITPSSATITSIVLNCTSGYEKTWSASTGSAPVVNTTAHTVTWSGSTTSAITLTNTASAQARISSIDVTYTSSGGGSTPTLYTVTLGDNSTSLTQTTEGGNVTLPAREGNSTYTFAGWSTTNNTEETTTAPTIISAGNYKPTANITLYPVYTRTDNGGSTDVSQTYETAVAPTGWTSNSITRTNGTGITSHGGSYWGSIAVNGTAYIQYNTALTGNVSVTAYVARTTSNTNKGEFKIQTKTSAGSWTDRATLDVANSTVDEWQELSWTGTLSEEQVRILYTGGTTAVRAIDDVCITYSTSATYYISSIGEEKPTPELSFSPAVYNYTMGEEFTAPTLTNSEGVPVTYSASNVTPANCIEVAENGTVTINAAGSATITASFAGDEDYNPASASYTLNVAPAPLSTMDAIYAKAQEVGETATEVSVKFNNWVVTGVKNSNAYLTDGNKGMLIYKSGHGFEVGDILSGTLTTKLLLYNGTAEFNALTATTPGLTVTKGGSVEPINVATNNLDASYTGVILHYENMTYNAAANTFSDGENTITPYYSLYDYRSTLIDGKTYNITGVYTLLYNESKNEILPRSAEDIELVEILNNYKVTFAETLNGTITVKNGETVINNGDEVAEGTTLTIECTPTDAENYRFQNWQYKEGEGPWTPRYTNPQDYTMPSANVQFKANFEVIPTYTVAFSVNGAIVQSDALKEGAAVTAPSDPEAINSKVFTGWIETATVEGATPAYVTPITTATKTVTYYAVFATQTGSGETNYELVESALDDWTGDYLIVYNNTYAMNTHSGNQNANTFATYTDISEYYSGETKSIASNSTTNALVYRAAATTNGYSLYSVGDESYLGITANTTSTGAKLRWNTSYTESADDWTLGVGSIGNVGSNTLYIRWNNNSGSYRFAAYASTGQQAIQLFKKTDGGYSDYTTIPEVTFTSAGTIDFVANDGEGNYYATFSSNKITAFPTDPSNDVTLYVEAVVVNGDGTIAKTDFYEDFESMNEDMDKVIIPANTGVLLHVFTTEDAAPSVSYEYTNAESENSEYDPEFNMLRPTSVTMEGDYKFYKLAYENYTNKTGLGFWYGAADGAAFTTKAGGAYLAVPTERAAALRGFSFGGEATAIKAVDAAANNAVRYNLNGQRISNAVKGIVVVNGKKHLIK